MGQSCFPIRFSTRKSINTFTFGTKYLGLSMNTCGPLASGLFWGQKFWPLKLPFCLSRNRCFGASRVIQDLRLISLSAASVDLCRKDYRYLVGPARFELATSTIKLLRQIRELLKAQQSCGIRYLSLFP